VSRSASRLDDTTVTLAQRKVAALDTSVVSSIPYYDRQSQGYKTRQETVQLLVDQIFVEKEIEKVKLGFQETQGFSVYAIMALFDKEMRGNVSLVEFNQVCERLLQPVANIHLLRQEVEQVFAKFDKDRDGYLDLQEFREFLLPLGDK
jgi:hypothetical protein